MLWDKISWLLRNLVEIAPLFVILGGALALLQWHYDQKWKRMAASFERIRAFSETPGTHNAMMILSCAEREIPLWDPQHPPASGLYTIVTWKEAEVALLPRLQSLPPKLSAIRDSFGDFLDRMTQIQMYIETGLLKQKDVWYLVEPWAKRLNGTIEDGHLTRNFRMYVDSEHKFAVQELFRSFEVDLVGSLSKDYSELKSELAGYIALNPDYDLCLKAAVRIPRLSRWRRVSDRLRFSRDHPALPR